MLHACAWWPHEIQSAHIEGKLRAVLAQPRRGAECTKHRDFSAIVIVIKSDFLWQVQNRSDSLRPKKVSFLAPPAPESLAIFHSNGKTLAILTPFAISREKHAPIAVCLAMGTFATEKCFDLRSRFSNAPRCGSGPSAAWRALPLHPHALPQAAPRSQSIASSIGGGGEGGRVGGKGCGLMEGSSSCLAGGAPKGSWSQTHILGLWKDLVLADQELWDFGTKISTLPMRGRHGGVEKRGGRKTSRMTPLPKRGFGPPSYGTFSTPLACRCSVFPVQKSTTEQTRSSFGGVQYFSGGRILWYVFLPPYVLHPPISWPNT